MNTNVITNHMDTYFWVDKVINSCTTKKQAETGIKLVGLWRNMYINRLDREELIYLSTKLNKRAFEKYYSLNV